jgi:hypothetical protein
MFAAILGVLGPIIGTVVKNVFPDPTDELKRIEVQQQLQMALLSQAGAIEQAAADIIKTEAASGSWLTSSWRPLTMLTFVGLIVAKWLGYSAPGISEALELKLLSIIEIGLGGYVIGRSVEKAAGPIAAALKGK